MERKTQGVYDLTATVLQSLPAPYGEAIIEEVFVAIEHNPQWQRQYDLLSTQLRAWVVNNWIGKYTQQMTGMQPIRGVASKRSTLIKGYSKLAHPSPSLVKVA